MINTVKRTEIVPIDKIVPYARNARTHSPEQIAQIRASFREFGVIAPLVTDENYNLLVGHGRLEAARAEGLTEMTCIVVEHLTEAQKRAYIIADNRLALNAGWDDEMLSVEISDLKDNAFDLSTLGFTDDELDKLMGLPDDASEDDFDLSTALEKAAFVEYGDIWTLGRHRLMCGDATIAADVDKLMGGKKANLCVTDIPYGVNFKSSSGLSIENDNLKGEEFYDFLLAAFTNIANALDKTGSVYVFHADSNGLVTRRAFDDAGLKLAETCIWVKNSQVLGHADYMYSHESILYGWRKDGRHKFFGDRTQKTVWNFDKPKKSENHPNAKPVELMALPVKNSSQANGIVIDLFAGGGSTLIACEQLNRACFMMELDPKYASLILRRYAEFTGNAGEDISVVRNGETIGYKELVKDVENS